jgi:hypothetical protein
MDMSTLEAGYSLDLLRDLRFPPSKRTGGMKVELVGKKLSRTGSISAGATVFAKPSRRDVSTVAG